MAKAKKVVKGKRKGSKTKTKPKHPALLSEGWSGQPNPKRARSVLDNEICVYKDMFILNFPKNNKL